MDTNSFKCIDIKKFFLNVNFRISHSILVVYNDENIDKLYSAYKNQEWDVYLVNFD